MSRGSAPWTPRKIFDTVLAHGLKCIIWNLPLTPWRVDASRRVPVEWCVISGVATGGDQIVAESVLAMDHSRLRAVLPLQPDDYAEDFAEGPERDAYRALLARDNVHIEVASPAPGADDSGDARQSAYRAAGRRMVDSCDLLIAVWNGEPGNGPGGTADTVEYAVNRRVPVYWIRADKPRKRVRVIAGWKRNRSGYKTRRLPRTARRIAPRYHRIAAFYRDPAFNKRRFAEELTETLERFRAHAGDAGLTGGPFDSHLARRVTLYEYANHLATRHQRFRNRSAVTLFALAALAVSAVAFHLIVVPDQRWLVLGEIALMTLAGVLLRVSRRESWHEKWLFDRYLAERVRSLIFCEIARAAAKGHPDTEPDSSP
ncbi:MAG: hypothetical protein L0271_26200, partial [Gemmatimonadetes bacterium]|nr:hypothetical protein [Gemmatimonadota bacterium]